MCDRNDHCAPQLPGVTPETFWDHFELAADDKAGYDLVEDDGPPSVFFPKGAAAECLENFDKFDRTREED